MNDPFACDFPTLSIRRPVLSEDTPEPSPSVPQQRSRERRSSASQVPGTQAETSMTRLPTPRAPRDDRPSDGRAPGRVARPARSGHAGGAHCPGCTAPPEDEPGMLAWLVNAPTVLLRRVFAGGSDRPTDRR
jgi:hypothetical protein